MGEPAMKISVLEDHPSAENERRSEDSQPIGFGDFIALPASRTLLYEGKPIALGGRAFDLLIVLLRSRGEIVSKEEIFRFVWPSTIVDESNLRFQMTVLRKALGGERERIKTISGRGYLFVEGRQGRADSARLPTTQLARNTDLSGQTVRMPAIVIIDQDRENREALRRLLKPFNARIEAFVSLADFLKNGSIAQG